jgi:hypothetical protein
MASGSLLYAASKQLEAGTIALNFASLSECRHTWPHSTFIINNSTRLAQIDAPKE